MGSNIKLTSAELSQLWAAYITNSMANRMLKHFEKTTDDSDIHAVVKTALAFSEAMDLKLKQHFLAEKLPIPYGFTDDDVHLEAPKLFTDKFVLEYLKQLMGFGIASYGISLTICPREDIRETFKYAIAQTTEQLDTIIHTLLTKGMYIRPPFIPYPQKAEYVHKEAFLNAFFGDRRALTSIEITHLFFNTLTNSLGKALITGFLQVSHTPAIKAFMKRGKGISSKHIEVFGSILRDDDISSISTWESEITDSTTSPFSEKLMMYHLLYINGAGMGSYGNAMATSQRRDLGITYARLIAEIATYLDDGAEIMVKLGWFEMPPSAVERNKLAGI
ncbi:DUF3231 family protein [Neobacillus cucumis]|uniref:DUF3231 family protein n=1 Tax=Neobacillus cucumis TaxID=1740721 RepID=UPI001966BD32|nr:DUF3231 family protein [Neobacillus cucumis]MBM7652563.1 hypothetical protein [Neobacillus cucumis]